MANLGSMLPLSGLPGLVLPTMAAGTVGGNPGAQDRRYPGGYSEDGVRAPIPNTRDRLIMRGIEGGAAAEEEKDNTDWIFNIPEVCCRGQTGGRRLLAVYFLYFVLCLFILVLCVVRLEFLGVLYVQDFLCKG